MSCRSQKIRIIGVPMDLGQSRRGVDMGPSAVRYAGLAEKLQQLDYATVDSGNLDIPGRFSLTGTTLAERLGPIREGLERTYALARATVGRGEIPIFLGGDHSIAIGTVGGITHDREVGLLWIDAHGDFNTPATSQSGNVHGMTLAVLLGEGFPELLAVGRPGPKLHPDDVVMIALRELDPGERGRLLNSGIMVYTMRDIDERGIGTVIRLALQRLEHHHRIHVSLDVDCLDVQAGPGVGTPVPGGLTWREAQLAMELIADCGCCGSLDIVEINPILDQQNRTAWLAVELAASLFGKRIL